MSRIISVKASLLGSRWDTHYHLTPEVSISQPTHVLGEITKIRRGISIPASKYVGKGDGVAPYVRIADLSHGSISARNVKYVHLKGVPARAMIRPREVLFSITGTLGKTALVPRSFDRAIVGSQIAILDPNERYVHPEFLARVLRSKHVKDQISRVQTGCIIKHLPVSEIARLRVRIPPVEAQREILGKIRRLESDYEVARESLARIEERLEKLLESD